MINQYEKKIYSQNGEDGIIEEIFNRISPTNHYFAEFGIESGLECNSRLLVEQGWKGIMIEGSQDYAQMAKNTYKDFPVTIVNNFITKDNILDIFTNNFVHQYLDLLSVDIDGNDYWVLNEILGKYKPKVIIVEYNAHYEPPKKWVMKYNSNHTWDGTDYQGASLTSLTNLCDKYNYALIGTDSKGVNAFFVDKLYLKDNFSELTPEQAYHPPTYYGHLNNGKYGHPHKDGEFIEI